MSANTNMNFAAQQSENVDHAEISIVGLGVKLPGANDKVEFFEMLKNKISGIGKVPEDRWNTEKFTDKGSIPSKICTDRGGFLEDIHEFDNLEFGISPNEAYDMDAHQMILLSTVLQAFEDAGMAYRGTKCGVFVAGSQDAHNITRDGYELGAYAATGAALSVQANRISFSFDLNGPSIYVDTACSGGLTAVHLARNSILAGDCDTAVVCGISIMCSPNPSQSFSKLGTLSPDGVCRAFDAGANGYVRGEGCAVVILKRTADAIRDGNHIYAEISGSAINANGRGTSLTMPESKMQMATTLSAYQQSGRSPLDAVYVECHGTGTNVGDPIEANGVGQVFTPGRADDSRLPIGSVKTNVGHLETGAGVVSLIKAAMILDSGLLLPSLNFSSPNPKIKWNDYMIKVQTEVEPIPASKLTADGKFVASVSSFGFGGANAHMVLERRPRAAEADQSALTDADPFLVATGGMTTKSLGNVQNNIKEAWASVADVSSSALLSRIITERARGHSLMSYAVASHGAELKFGDHKLTTPKELNPLKLFVFSGQGPQHDEMGRKLYARYPAFRDSIERSDGVLQRHFGKSFVRDFGFFDPASKTTAPTDKDGVWPVEFIVISITMFQIALFDLWAAIGLEPDAVAGHSVGEIAAMYASGAVSQEQSIRLAIARSNALAQLASVNGSMAALGVSPAKASELIRDVLAKQKVPEGLWLSAHNSVSAVSVSGKEDLIVALVKEADAQGIFARQLRVGGPYHSPMVDLCEESFRNEVEPLLDTACNVPKHCFVSTVDGQVHAPGKHLGSQYCWDNIRKPVLLKPAIDAFQQLATEQDRNAIIIEVAPHGVLASYLDEISKAFEAEVKAQKQAASDDSAAATTGERGTTIVSCARRPNKKMGETRDTPAEVSQFLDAAGRILSAGARGLNICTLQGLKKHDSEIGYNTGRLPGFPLQKIRHEFSEDPVGKHRRLGYNPKPLGSPLFRMSPQTHSWTLGHQIRGAIVVPGAAYLEAAFESGARTLKNVKIHRALVLNEDGPPKYCGFRQTGVQGGWTFSSASKVTVDDSGVILDTLHASGEAHQEASTVGPADMNEHFGGADFLDDFDLALPADKFFSKIDSTGASYTREFAMITKLMASSKRERDYLCYVDPLPDLWTTKEARGMSIHPGLLDSLLLATWMLGFSFEDESKLIKDTYMPSAFNEVSLIASPEELKKTKGFLTHFTCLEANEHMTVHDMTLFDRETGKTLVIIRGLHSPRVKEDKSETVAYTETWEPRSLALDDEVSLCSRVQLTESEAATALAGVHLDASAPKADTIQQIYSINEVRTSLFDAASSLVKDIISISVAKQNRKVFRVLEVYAHHKKLKLASLGTFAAKLGVHLEVVPLNIAKCKKGSDEYLDGPFDLAHAVEEAGDRVRPASFDVVFGVDVLRSTGGAAVDASIKVDELLVPGGIKVFAELSSANQQIHAAVGEADSNAVVSQEVVASIKGEVHNLAIGRRRLPLLHTSNGYKDEVSSRWSTFTATRSSDSSGSKSASDSGRASPTENSSRSSNSDGAETPSTPPVGSQEFNEGSPRSKHAKLAAALEMSPVKEAALPVIETPDHSTIVYYYRPDTETQLVEAVRDLGDNPSGKVWVMCDDNPDGSRGLALAGTMENEFPGIKAYGVAFGIDIARSRRNVLLEQLMALEPTKAVEPFTLIRDDGASVLQRRIIKAPSIEAQQSTSDWVLDLSDKVPSACVEALVPHKYQPAPLRDDEVLVSTQAVALNFKNVLSATGLLPPHDRLSEFAGTVIAKGAKANRFQIGDRVMGSSNFNREGTQAIAGELSLTKVPENMSTQDAAAFPIAYGTVYHGLVQLANIRQGDTILIHAAAGGVGLCAIQIAQRRGLEIFCTVGSQEKRDYLHNNFGIPYSNMSNSRSIAEWTGDGKRWLQERGRIGFDVVLNSLQGASLQAGLDSLGHLGRFVDISKRDHLAGNPMTMGHFAKAISYHAIELGLLGYKYPERMASLMDEVAAEHAREPFHHLIGHHFHGAQGLIGAYALMESGKHIGKIVVDLSEACEEGATTAMLPPKPIFDPRKSYVLVGGCGGLGPRLALMMITNGARKLILTGRRGKLDLVEIRAIKNLARDKLYPGVDVRPMAANALDEDDMTRVFDTANEMAPLGGVYLMAVTLADDQFVNMDKAKFDKVTSSKIGALNVVRKLVDVPSLDFLFLFSSTAALYFNPGQANYNAAQGYFNRLATEHRNIISFAVPAISDVGVFAQLLEAKGNTAATKSMLALACTSRELCERIGDAIARTTTGQAVPYYIPGNLDWTVGYKIAESCRTSFSHLAEHDDDKDDSADDDETSDVDPVVNVLSKLLNLEVDAIEDTAFLSSLGLDSLSASKLSSLLSSEFDVKMTQLQLLGPVSVSALRNIVAASTESATEGASTSSSDAEAQAAKTASIGKVNYAADVDKFDKEAITGDKLGSFDLGKIDANNGDLHALVTGGTGYLGSTVLASVLAALPKASITALVQASSPEAGAERLKATFAKYGLDAAPLDRVKVVLGNVTQPRLGLSSIEWTALASEVDLIFQAHGKADHVAGYQSLVGVNAYSTSQVLKLAGTAKPKALCYFGSTNMWATLDGARKGGDPGTVHEDFDLASLSESLQGGYRQSKWVSESLVAKARARGQTVLVVRPGTLGGKALTRAGPVTRENFGHGRSEDSFMSRSIIGCAQFGYAPIVSANFSETPIDWFGLIFGRLIMNSAAWTGERAAFHIKSPHSITFQDDSGSDATWKMLPYDEWAAKFKEYVKTDAGKNNALAPLVGYLDHLVSLPDFDMRFTRAVLGDDFVECPKV